MITTKTFTVDARLNPDQPRTMGEIREDFPQLPAKPAAPYLLLYRNGSIHLKPGLAPIERSTNG